MTFQEIQAAAERLHGQANRTPVMTSRTLDEIAGARVFLKCENFQRIGAFKFRGAYNAMAQLDDAARAAGVVTQSSGNHAQATALAGRLLGIAVTVAMPNDAPTVKRSATEGYGARVVTYDPLTENREEVTQGLMDKHGYTYIPPFDHPQVIAGQGTVALELLDEVGPLDAVLAPCGGGGLLSGTAIAVKHLAPQALVFGVEPQAADNGTRSFRSGRIERVPHAPTMADGLRPGALGEHTLQAMRSHVDQMFTVSEEDMRVTLEFMWQRMKLLAEPSGAVGLAPLFTGAFWEDPLLDTPPFRPKRSPEGPRIGVIITGGNADIGAVADWLRAGQN